MAVFELPVSLRSAFSPLAVLKLPAVLLKRLNAPFAVFELPLAFFDNALMPIAVLSPPAVLPTRACQPAAVFSAPLLFVLSASKPVAVLLLAVSYRRAE